MKNDLVQILDVAIHNVTMEEALIQIKGFLNQEAVHMIFTPNSEMLMLAQQNKNLKSILNAAALTVADGAGVVMASKILKTPLKERVAGIDLVCGMFSSAHFKDTRYYLLGTKQEILDKAKAHLAKTYNANIVGSHHGYFNHEAQDKIIQDIHSSGAQVLLVALGVPRQEEWIFAHRSQLKVHVVIGVGGSLDVFAGVSHRAPLFYQRYHLEWLYRLMKEPWRYKRMLKLPQFMLSVIRHRFRIS
jgi:N-acetylglucosaminyldiphosphoundecaprenol N-acetyl-beta-D-mannosaminyltransferase